MKYFLTALALTTTLLSAAQQSTGISVKPNYRLAARFAPEKLKRMIFSTEVVPNWLALSDRFWYSYETPAGKNWYLVDPATAGKQPLFNHAALAAQLNLVVKDPINAKNLPITNLQFTKDEQHIRFEVTSTRDTLKSKEERAKSKVKTDTLKKKVFYFEYEVRTQRLTELSDSLKLKAHMPWASFSPDTSVVVFAKKYNLYWMTMADYRKAQRNEEDSTIKEHQLTTDGVAYYAWGGDSYSKTTGEDKKEEEKRKKAGILWSPNSKYFILTRKDNRHLGDLWVINNVAAQRPTLETYKYMMPGETDSTRQELYLFDFTTKQPRQLPVEAFKNQSITLWSKPEPIAQPAGAIQPDIWLGSNEAFYFARTSRDQKKIDMGIMRLNGSLKVLVEERSNTYQDIRRPELLNNGSELVHWSERDGWGHYYLYDSSGRLKNQITSGEFSCANITGLDEKTRTLYFAANGREAGEDPYYQHLYSIQLNGASMQLLNPGNFDHQSNMNDRSRFFVNNASRVNTTPVSDLYNAAGKKILHLETADLSGLFAAGYRFPEPFTVKADDGVTDLYGVLYKPFDFDSTRSYPLIEYVYPGPQTEAVNKAFGRSLDRIDRLAQLGFIVITVGNRGGHPARSRWYHQYGYGNLRDYGLADKKAAAEQLADRHRFIDISRMGIHGHSGGGFMSTAAMLVYPDFFKVAVSCAGNHENNIYNRHWSERHHGVTERITPKGDTTFSYNIDKNTELAKNLKGHLLLVTGDIDNNVHPANTIRMADALIKANKRFDFLLLPGQRHAFGPMTEYFFWKMADYFSKHLLGSNDPGVDIEEMNREVPRGR